MLIIKITLSRQILAVVHSSDLFGVLFAQSVSLTDEHVLLEYFYGWLAVLGEGERVVVHQRTVVIFELKQLIVLTGTQLVKVVLSALDHVLCVNFDVVVTVVSRLLVEEAQSMHELMSYHANIVTAGRADGQLLTVH